MKNLNELPATISWIEWKERWADAKDLPTCLGLLHSGFKTTVGKDERMQAELEADRIIFYLEIAQKQNQDSEVSRKCADKALTVVTDNFFCFYKGGEERINTFYTRPPELFDAVCDFFRVEQVPHRRPVIANLHERAAASEFSSYGVSKHVIKKLGLFTEEFGKHVFAGYQGPSDVYFTTVMIEHKRRVFPLWYKKKQFGLELLLTHEDSVLESLLPISQYGLREHLWEKFTPDVLQRLEEFALAQSKGCKTLEEAIAHCQRPAQIALTAKLAVAEVQRRQKTAAAEKELLEAKRKLESLA